MRQQLHQSRINQYPGAQGIENTRNDARARGIGVVCRADAETDGDAEGSREAVEEGGEERDVGEFFGEG